MLVYSKQFLQDGAGATKWIRIAQQSKATQDWFPEEGGAEWFVDTKDAKKLKLSSRDRHPAGDVYVLVIFMLFGTASISHSCSSALLREQTHPTGVDVDKNATLLPELARLWSNCSDPPRLPHSQAAMRTEIG
jgi:hypothetical protein